MSRRSARFLKAGLTALHYSGADSIIASLTRGVGAIFVLHQVSPESPAAFEPNRILRITPEFLEQVIDRVQTWGFEVLSLDEAHFRLVEGDFRPFVCFTFDDGYRDNFEYAYPIFKRRNLPFAIYVPTDFADGVGNLWWLALERAIGKAHTLNLKIGGSARRMKCGTPSQKDAAFNAVYWWLRGINEDDARSFVADLCSEVGADTTSLCADLVMNWHEVRQLASDPLVTIGAHTRRHYALAKLTLSEARAEIFRSTQRIERELNLACRHFSFPYGDEASAGVREFDLVKELGMKTAVTTRKGLVQREHASALTALPRVSLNGDYQHLRYVKVLLSGAPFAVLDLVKKGSKRSSALVGR